MIVSNGQEGVDCATKLISEMLERPGKIHDKYWILTKYWTKVGRKFEEG